MSRIRVRGQLLLRTTPGHELERISTHRDVRAGTASAAIGLDGGGRLDQLIRQRTSAMLATRAFYARRALGLGLGAGAGHLDYDDLEHELGLSRTFRVQVAPDAPVDKLVRDLAALDQVEMASPVFVCEMTEPSVKRGPASPRIDRARELIGADRALDLEPGDTALIIGLIDSGVDMDHPELIGRLRPGLSSVGLLPDSVEGDLHIIAGAHSEVQDVSDDEGHGTACAGLLCATGYRIGRGVAGASRLLPIRSLCGALVPGASKPTAIGLLPDIDSGLKTAIDLGARVLNLSFGTPESEIDDGPVPHIEMVRYALAHDCILVAASGNTGRAERYFPAALPGVIAVGAVDDERRPASFTTRGDHVALCAPGVGIAGLGIDGYGLHNGTSFAAPFVTGACALLMARAARLSRPLGQQAARRILTGSASRFAPGADSAGCGAGILDMTAALLAIDDAYRNEPNPDARAA